MAQFIRSDLEFILEQIAIAEAHAAGTPLQQLIANPTLSSGCARSTAPTTTWCRASPSSVPPTPCSRG